MKDILGPLQQRLAQINKREDFEIQRHDAAMAAIKRDRKIVTDMIALETDSPPDVQQDFFPAKTVREVPAAQLEAEILVALKNQRDWTHADLKARLLAKGLGDSDDPQFGRRLQGTLLSMRSRSAVENTGVGVWRISAGSKNLEAG